MFYKLNSFVRAVKLHRRRRMSIVLQAVDSSKFRHTLKGANEIGSDSRLLSDFKLYFPSLSNVNTRDQLLSMVSMNSDVRDWYSTWNVVESQTQSYPEFVDKASSKELTAYTETIPDALALKARQKAWQDRINLAAKTMKDTVTAVETEKRAYLAQLKPFHVISLVTVNQLPAEKQAAIAAVSDKQARAKLTAEYVLSYQKELVKQVELGVFKNPFAS